MEIINVKILFKIIIANIFAALFVNAANCQTVINGSFDGVPTGNSNFLSFVDWDVCYTPGMSNSPDVCDVGFPSFNGSSTVTPVFSPDGGNWAGIAHVGVSEAECFEGQITGLTIGDSYSLQFYGANFGSGYGSIASGPLATIEISVGSVVTTEDIPITDATWFNYCVAFTADATNMLFTVQNIAGDAYAGLDGFTVVNYVNQNINIGDDTNLCSGNTLLLDATTPNATYLWQDNSTDPTFEVTGPGTYWVEVSNSCEILTDSIIITYDQLPSINFGNDSLLCDNSTLILDATNSNSTYLWQDNSTNPTFEVTDPGTYWVEVTNNCESAADTIIISTEQLPFISFGDDSLLCENGSILLDASNTSATYIWQDNSTLPTYTVNTAGTYWVEVSNNCNSISDTILISYGSVPTFSIGNDTSICAGEVLNLSANISNVSYLWQDNSTNATFDAKFAGTYSLTATNECGSSTESMILETKNCNCNLYVPTAFSPNEDGTNDLFIPYTNCNLTKYQLIIFNRWGENIFSTFEFQDYWDGHYLGNRVPLGVYSYMLIYQFEALDEIKKTGNVTVVY